MNPETGSTPDRFWPSGQTPDPENCVDAACESCGLTWRMHRSMAGYRLQCECGAWIQAPPREEPLPAQLAPPEEPTVPMPVRERIRQEPLTEDGCVQLPAEFTEAVHEPVIPTDLPLAPGTLRMANHVNRGRWTNRSLLELIAILAAFLVPSGIVYFTTVGRTQAIYQPLASLASGILVLLVGLSARHYTFSGLRLTSGRYMVEGLAVGIAGATAAIGWWQILLGGELVGPEDGLGPFREELGLGLAIFVICFCPAVFEELAFRGLVQGRFAVLFGRWPGYLVTGATFALAHGIGAGSPFHLFLGIYLCSLRDRSASLLPCISLHFVYNLLLLLAC